jgi:hypothetical protein
MSDNEQSPVAGFRNPNQPARRRGRFLVLVPFKDLELKADQGDPGHSLQLPDVVDGLEIEDIVAHVAASEIDAGFEYRVGIQSSLDGLKWSTSTNLLAFSGASQIISQPFTDRTKFGRLLRFELGYRKTSDPVGATLSLLLVIKYFQP